MLEPPSGCPKVDPSERLVFRRGRLRKREDDEVRMMREALASLEDLPRLKRLLLELGRFYNPVTNGPVLGSDVRRAVVDRLEHADVAGARTVLEQQLAAYLKMDEPPPPSSPSPAAESGGRQ
jgi:hypothetical protein